jgi:hypothetical protein
VLGPSLDLGAAPAAWGPFDRRGERGIVGCDLTGALGADVQVTADLHQVPELPGHAGWTYRPLGSGGDESSDLLHAERERGGLSLEQAARPFGVSSLGGLGVPHPNVRFRSAASASAPHAPSGPSGR